MREQSLMIFLIMTTLLWKFFCCRDKNWPLSHRTAFFITRLLCSPSGDLRNVFSGHKSLSHRSIQTQYIDYATTDMVDLHMVVLQIKRKNKALPCPAVSMSVYCTVFSRRAERMEDVGCVYTALKHKGNLPFLLPRHWMCRLKDCLTSNGPFTLCSYFSNVTQSVTHWGLKYDCRDSSSFVLKSGPVWWIDELTLSSQSHWQCNWKYDLKKTDGYFQICRIHYNYSVQCKSQPVGRRLTV